MRLRPRRTVTWSRRALGALLAVAGCALVVASSSCGAPAAAAPPADEPVGIAPSELARLEAAAARVGPLEARLAALEKEHAAVLERLKVAEQRLGIAPFDTKALERLDMPLKLQDAQILESRSGKARKRSLQKELAGTDKGLVIAFWATWCKPCTSDEELARLKRLSRDLEAVGSELVFLAVDGLDKVVSDPRADRWVYPLWQKDQGHLQMLPESFVRARGVDLPLFLVVKKDQRIAWVRNQALDDVAVRDIVTAVMR